MSSRPTNHQRKVMASWKATIIKNVDSLADLSAQTLLKALQDGDRTVAVFMFKLLYHRSTAWRKRLEFDDDPAQAQKEMEQAFRAGRPQYGRIDGAPSLQGLTTEDCRA